MLSVTSDSERNGLCDVMAGGQCNEQVSLMPVTASPVKGACRPRKLSRRS
jgi:hypothetical protein